MKKITLFAFLNLFVFNFAFGQLDKTLIATLDTIHQDDQRYRQQLWDIIERYGRTSEEVEAHWRIIRHQDSINLIRIEKILTEHGWLGADVIGEEGNRTLFLVIQHSNLETWEKYLPMMREAVSKGNARASDFAMLQDRAALERGGKQIFGTQVGIDPKTGIRHILPLIDPENVDKRRAKVGLMSMYLATGGTWDVEEYKRNLPELMEILRLAAEEHQRRQQNK